MSEGNEQNTTRSGNGIYIIIILLLLVGLAVMAMQWSKKNSELNQCSNDNTLLKADMAGMNEMMSGYVDNMSNDLKYNRPTETFYCIHTDRRKSTIRCCRIWATMMR